jgi:Prp8 binding protein
MAKRAAPQDEGTLIKRARSSEPEANNQQLLAISSSNDERQKALVRSVKRTSNLEAPIVSLSGAHGVSFSRPMSPRYSEKRALTGGDTKL